MIPDNGASDEEQPIEVSIVPTEYDKRMHIALWMVGLSLLISLVLAALVGVAVLKMSEEIDQHRLREQEHQCFSARDRQKHTRGLRNIAIQAGYDPSGLPIRLEPEVQAVCDLVDARS